eukprot:57274_1
MFEPQSLTSQASNEIPPKTLPLYRHQVAGKLPLLWNEGQICKPAFQDEVDFYKCLPTEFPDLVPFIPQFCGLLDLEVNKEQKMPVKRDELTDILKSAEDEKAQFHEKYSVQQNDSDDDEAEMSVSSSSSDSENDLATDIICGLQSPAAPKGTRKRRSHSIWASVCLLRMNKKHQNRENVYIALEDMTRHFKRPCILDLKIGFRQYGNDASPLKVQMQRAKVKATTSHSVGLRLCGMQAFQVGSRNYRFRDKYFGRRLTKTEFKRILAQFFHNGEQFRADIIPCFIRRLEALYRIMENQRKFYFYSSSLLLVYEGDVANMVSSSGDTSRTPSPVRLRRSSSGSLHAPEIRPPGPLSVSARLIHNCHARTNSSPVTEKGGGRERPKSSHAHLETDESTSPTHSHKKAPCQLMDVRLIDFANIVKRDDNDSAVDEGLLLGLRNMIRYLKSFLRLHEKIESGGLQRT